MDAGLHRPERNAARVGNLPVGHARHFLEHEGFPLVVGQPPERRFHFGAAADVLFRLAASGPLPRVSGRARHFEEPPLPAGAAERVVGGANRDPAQPGSDRSFTPVTRCPAEGAEVGLLGGVFGFGAVPQDGEGDGTNPGLGPADQIVEGANVSLIAEPAKQPPLFGILPGSFLLAWFIRSAL